MRVVSFRVEDSILSILYAHANKSRLTVSEVIRRALYEYLEKRGYFVGRV